MRTEGRFAIDPQDAEIYIGGKLLLSDLLKHFEEGDILRVQVDRVAKNTPIPMFLPRVEKVRL